MKKLVNVDKWTLFLVIFLSALGIVNFFSASYYYSLKNFNSPYFYFLRFLLRITFLGFLFFLIGNILARDLRKYKRLFFILFLILYLSLLLSFLPQFRLPQASSARWLNLGFISFQPSELIKPLAILIFIFILLQSKKPDFNKKIINFFAFSIFLLTPIFLQPSFSNVMIILASLITVFFTFLKTKKEFFETILVFILFFLILVLIAFNWGYRKERILSFLTKGELHGEKYFQVTISQIGISSGSVLGKGLGRSETKIIGIPQLLTDSIFVVYAEELGFVGSLFLILLFLILIITIIYRGIKSNDEIKKFFCFGVSSWILVQTFFHLASNVGLIVPTGVVLPFFSYGASSQLAIYFSLGIISRND
jgi:cell division protein FtsW